MEIPEQIVRGFEIVHYNGFTREWDVVGKFRSTELAARQAGADLKWLRERHPYDLYELRGLVSVVINKRKEPEPPPPDIQLAIETVENPKKPIEDAKATPYTDCVTYLRCMKDAREDALELGAPPDVIKRFDTVIEAAIKLLEAVNVR